MNINHTNGVITVDDIPVLNIDPATRLVAVPDALGGAGVAGTTRWELTAFGPWTLDDVAITDGGDGDHYIEITGKAVAAIWATGAHEGGTSPTIELVWDSGVPSDEWTEFFAGFDIAIS